MSGRRKTVTQDQIDLNIRFVESLVGYYGAKQLAKGIYSNPFDMSGGSSFISMMSSGGARFGDKPKAGMLMSVTTMTRIANKEMAKPSGVVQDHSHAQSSRITAQ